MANGTETAVADYFAATRSNDVDAWVSTFAEDAVSYDPVDGPPLQGHAALRQFYVSMASVFEAMGLMEDHVFVVGNKAAVKWTGLGKGKNGRTVRFEGIDVFEVNGAGKIQTMWGYWNPAEVMADLSK